MKKSNEESNTIWKQFLLEEYVKHVGYIPFISNETDYYAVIIEPRSLSEIFTAIKTTMFYLNESNSIIKWGLQIFHGTDNYNFIYDVTKEWGEIEYTNIGVENFTHMEHSRYMETPEFWEKVKGKKVLIFQADSMIIRHGIDEFLEYDYVGAPWRKPKENQ